MSDFVSTHQPCPDCESSDGLAINEDGSSKCFVCDTFTPQAKERPMPTPSKILTKPNELPQLRRKIEAANFAPITERAFDAQTTAKFKVIKDSDGNIIMPYYDPEEPTIVVAAKVRTPDKKFFIHGDIKKAGLFGQSLFGKGGKYITIVEGELDALAVRQMMGDYPVVSIKNGAASALKDCQDQYEWLDSFENIIVCFDSDKPGQDAAKKVCSLFAGKAKSMKLELKDACEYCAKARFKDFKDSFWNADVFVPDGIVNAKDMWEEVNQPIQFPDASYPWKALNEITYGVRRAELVTITAGSGLGKSQFVREIFWHILNKKPDLRIGGLFLEETKRKTLLSIMSMAINKLLHLPKFVWSDDGEIEDAQPSCDEDELIEAFKQTAAGGRVFLFDHFGSTDADNIVGKCRYMIKALGVDVVFVDHISIIVSAQSNGDERKAIDEIMTKLRMLVQETDCMMFLVSHLKRPDGKGHEEGAATSLAQLRGSGSIAQLSDMVIGLERDAQHEEEIERNTTKVRLLKNRFSGETGPVTSLLWDKDSGRMFERQPAEEEAL